MRLCFVPGRPVSAITCAFLGWLAEVLAGEGKRALFLVWDNASWHVSRAVRAWVRAHNLRAKKGGGCRLVVCRLPVKAPWLHLIEPKWVHGKRATAEPTRALEPDELRQRLCDYYACDLLPLLSQEAA